MSGSTTIMDRYGRLWDLPLKEVCRTCRQPDNVGDCDHARLLNEEVLRLGGKLGEGFGFTTRPDKNIGREKVRHLLVPGGRRSLCGHPIVFAWGPNALPLSPDCKGCQRIAANAAWKGGQRVAV